MLINCLKISQLASKDVKCKDYVCSLGRLLAGGLDDPELINFDLVCHFKNIFGWKKAPHTGQNDLA